MQLTPYQITIADCDLTEHSENALQAFDSSDTCSEGTEVLVGVALDSTSSPRNVVRPDGTPSVLPALPEQVMDAARQSPSVAKRVSPEVEKLFVALLSPIGASRHEQKVSLSRAGLTRLKGRRRLEEPVIVKRLNTTITKPQVPQISSSWDRQQGFSTGGPQSKGRMRPEEYPGAACGLLEPLGAAKERAQLECNKSDYPARLGEGSRTPRHDSPRERQA
eukprot:CAMPEP_0117525002 /NCGR_PEP_ID=MMETSP0784-20121206/35540_1 /TAXON_ID=39447 /ORGANISM="" /LENGTH=219 /DNA_ID=CAMNT_0005321175 /DNA_START=123 /DNA_END=779 /DNA_ORIENTATION=+